MIYEIDLVLCATSAFFFKNIFTFALFLFAAYFIFKYLIQKLSNFTVILYLLFIICIFAGGIVLSLIPSRENLMCPIMINSYYLGPVTFTLFIALVISMIVDIIIMIKSNSDEDNDKKEKKTIKEKVEETKKEIKEKVTKKKPVRKPKNKKVKE